MFRFATGKLTTVRSRPLTWSGRSRDADVDTWYEMGLVLPNGGRLAAPFCARGADEQVAQMRPGDDVTFVHDALPGAKGDTSARPIVRIVDHTTEQSYTLTAFSANLLSRYTDLLMALGMVVLLLAIVFVVSGQAAGFAVQLVVPLILAAGFGVSRLSQRFPNAPRLTAASQGELGAPAELVEQLRELQAGRDACRSAIAEQEARAAPLRALREKMERVGRETYATRLDTLTRAIDLLSTQRDVQQRLLAGYERAIAMVEIEIESGALEDAVDDQIAAEIEAKRAELEELRERSADLERLVAANDEVARLLRPGGGGAA